MALEYIRCFAAGDIEGLGAVLAEGVQFTGPYLSVDSKQLTSMHSAGTYPSPVRWRS